MTQYLAQRTSLSVRALFSVARNRGVTPAVLGFFLPHLCLTITCHQVGAVILVGLVFCVISVAPSSILTRSSSVKGEPLMYVQKTVGKG